VEEQGWKNVEGAGGVVRSQIVILENNRTVSGSSEIPADPLEITDCDLKI